MADFMDFPTAREQVLSAGNTTIGVIPELCLVSHFQVGAWEVLYRPSETGNVKRWGLPLMIPNFARLKNGIFVEKGTTLPVHGFGRNLPWTIMRSDPTCVALQLESGEATRSCYPFEFMFAVTLEVAEGSLTYTLSMENRGDETMPIAPGFHPYFALPQKDKPRLVSDGPRGFAVSAFHWDSSPPDNSYPFDQQVTIDFPRRGTLTIAELPHAGNYSLKAMQVWSEPADTPDHSFVCFEPVVASEDGLNRPADRLNLAPHTTHQLSLQLTAEPL